MICSCYIPFSLQCELDDCRNPLSRARVLTRIVKLLNHPGLCSVRCFKTSDGVPRSYFSICDSCGMIVYCGYLKDVVTFLDALLFQASYEHIKKH